MSNISKKSLKRPLKAGALKVSLLTTGFIGAPKQSKNARLSSALAKARMALSEMTDEEDAAITAAALADPDAQPVDELMRRKGGRPRSDNPKQQVALRLDRDVIERFKAGGEGWQTRMNDALRKAVGLK
jgi:uncharacterized protein (DUF4415 family)